MVGHKTRGIIIGVVTTVWLVNFGAGFFIEGYETSESINIIFMTIVGGLFALGSKNKGQDKGEDD